MNYHASTATCCFKRSLVITHSGVQFSDKEADLLTAAFLVVTCSSPYLERSYLRFDAKILKDEIMGIVNNKKDVVSFTVANGPYCKTEKIAIDLLCFCSTPPGLKGQHQRHFTAKKNQKMFNWYHTHCLQFLGIEVPKKRSDIFCPRCTVTDNPKWHHDLFTNTCTVDNAITILMIAYKENPQL